jgi:ribonuclease D
MTDYSYIDSPDKLAVLIRSFRDSGTETLAMDFEEESNLHVYGEHLCIIQLYDGSGFYIIDALALASTDEGKALIKDLLEGPETKIMFDCSSDAAIVRKSLGIQLKNIYDIRLAAKALGFDGNLSSLIQRNLGVETDSPAEKKKYQKANWMKRPIPEAQLNYALNDVRYLFALKSSLEEEMSRTLGASAVRQLTNNMKRCANRRHRDKPGWEKICNYHMLEYREKVFIRHFFNARDTLARKANVPPTNIMEKQKIVQMAKAGTWEGILEGPSLRYTATFEKARLEAEKDLQKTDDNNRIRFM